MRATPASHTGTAVQPRENIRGGYAVTIRLIYQLVIWSGGTAHVKYPDGYAGTNRLTPDHTLNL